VIVADCFSFVLVPKSQVESLETVVGWTAELHPKINEALRDEVIRAYSGRTRSW